MWSGHASSALCSSPLFLFSLLLLKLSLSMLISKIFLLRIKSQESWFRKTSNIRIHCSMKAERKLRFTDSADFWCLEKISWFADFLIWADSDQIGDELNKWRNKLPSIRETSRLNRGNFENFEAGSTKKYVRLNSLFDFMTVKNIVCNKIIELLG